jgi:hypothetical protein
MTVTLARGSESSSGGGPGGYGGGGPNYDADSQSIAPPSPRRVVLGVLATSALALVGRCRLTVPKPVLRIWLPMVAHGFSASS